MIKRSGFTLIELLVVIAIFVILATLKRGRVRSTFSLGLTLLAFSAALPRAGPSLLSTAS